MLQIKDRPGVIAMQEMREHFERCIRINSALNDNTPLGHITLNGLFSHYADPDTDTMWLGFALGMRRMEWMVNKKA